MTEQETKFKELKLSPAAIANVFLFLSKKEGISITPMKLLKLVYFAYAWCLAVLKVKVFDENIEAWKFGPVIPSLFHEFKRYGSNAIDSFSKKAEIIDNEIQINTPVADNNDVLKVISSVWKTYKDKSAFELSDITHQENSPWSNARKSNEVLKDEEIRLRALEKINNL